MALSKKSDTMLVTQPEYWGANVGWEGEILEDSKSTIKMAIFVLYVYPSILALCPTGMRSTQSSSGVYIPPYPTH
ncbi:hypothetical protein EON65_38440 [archaeon]|nr:MAG: hypothetical protein EON65_38440 [archaeon]